MWCFYKIIQCRTTNLWFIRCILYLHVQNQQSYSQRLFCCCFISLFLLFLFLFIVLFEFCIFAVTLHHYSYLLMDFGTSITLYLAALCIGQFRARSLSYIMYLAFRLKCFTFCYGGADFILYAVLVLFIFEIQTLRFSSYNILKKVSGKQLSHWHLQYLYLLINTKSVTKTSCSYLQFPNSYLPDMKF